MATDQTTEQEMDTQPVDNQEIVESGEVKKTEDTHTAVTQKAETTTDTTTDTAVSHTDDISEAATPSAEDEANGIITDTREEEPQDDGETHDPVDDSAIVSGSLSRALRRCREQAGLTIEQAATDMRLPLSVIKALENENFADLPEPPYVRGYLRSYSRLIDSDPNDLINRYEVLRGANPDDIAAYTPTTPRHQLANKKSVSPTTIKLTGFSMIVLLLVMLSMIPAVSQWAADTWRAFAEPQNQHIASRSGSFANQPANKNDNNMSSADNSRGVTETNSASPDVSSQNDTPADSTGNSTQLALNQSGDSPAGTDTGETSEDGVQQNTGTDTPAIDTQQENSSTQSDTQGNNRAGDTTSNTDPTTPAAEGTDADTDTSLSDSDGSATGSVTNGDSTVSSAENAQTTDHAQPGNDDNKAVQSTDTAEGTTDQQNQQAAGTEQSGQAVQETPTDTPAEQQATGQEQNETQQAAATEQAPNNQFQQPIDGNVLIRLVFTQDVWMSIKNGQGKTIFSALNSAGTVKELKASAPLQFKVGNAPGVQVYLNGQLIDQRPYTRGSVANFRAN